MPDALPANFTSVGSTLGDIDIPKCTKLVTDYFGVVTAELTRRRAESCLPASLDWLRTAESPNFFGLPLMGVSRSYDPPWATYTYGYEGLPDGESLTGNLTLEYDLSMTEESIQTHPSWPTLRDQFLWSPITEKFPDIYPAALNSDGTPKGTGVVRNPMAGVEAYLSPGAIFRKTGVVKPDDEKFLAIFPLVGTPGHPDEIKEFPIPPTGLRNWLRLAPKIRKRGNVYEVIEEWQLSGPYGWNPIIYNSEAMWNSVNFGLSDSQGTDSAVPSSTGQDILRPDGSGFTSGGNLNA
jgi:hypothetical protein